VIGLDGASFEILTPWLKNGELSNIRKIRKNGVHADMQSVLPPVTSPNWKCYSTSMNPGKIGIFWWENVDVENKKVSYPSERTAENKELWELIGGKKGIVNMPLTYPLKEIDGYVISGPPDGPDEDYFRPEHLEDKLEKYNYKVRPKNEKYLRNGSEEEKQECVNTILEMIENKFDLAKELLKEDDFQFFHFTVFYINVLQHYFWNDKPTKRAWKLIDKKIGEFLDEFEEDYTFFFMSDHGANEIENVLNINTWLEEKGYLKTKTGKGKALDKLGLNLQNIAKMSKYLFSQETIDALKEKAPDSFIKSIPQKGGTFKKEQKGEVIDWENSKAIASGQGPIYIIGTEEEKEKIKEDLKEDLNELKEKGLIKNVFEKEEIYSGKYFNGAPDLILDQNKGVHIPGDVGKDKVVDTPCRWKGENKRTGLFMAYGDNIKEEYEVEQMSILDIAPTILHFYRKKIPDDMDGEVKMKIFKENSEIAKREVKIESKSEKERLDEAISEISI